MTKKIELEIRHGSNLLLHTGRGDNVTVPMDAAERARCRAVLLDALDLLNQTIVTWSTFAMSPDTEGQDPQDLQHIGGCLAVFDCPDAMRQPQADTGTRLRIVPKD